MLGAEHGQEGRGNYQQVSSSGLTSRVSQFTDRKLRLLLIFKKLEDINAAVNRLDLQEERLEEAKGLISAISQDHTSAAETYINDVKLRAELCLEVEDECHELVEYVVAAKRFKLDPDSKSKDRIVSVGEKLSCRFMTAVLKDKVWIS